MGQPLWKKSMVVPQKIKNRITLYSNNPSGYIPKRTESRVSKRCLYTHVHSSIIHNRQKVETTLVSTDRRTNKMWYIHATEYYSALKEKEILTQAVTG